MPAGRILVVEDHALNFVLVRDLLEDAGFNVLHVETGEEALLAARRERIDLVLMDIGLPGMHGLEAMRRLKEARETCNLPVVVLTAHAMRGDAERALSQGCDRFLTKPIDIRTFVDEIAAALSAARGLPG